MENICLKNMIFIQNIFFKTKSGHVLDKNNDGEISAAELTSGAEKAFKVFH